MNNDFINNDIQDIIIERDGYKEQVEEQQQEISRLNNIIYELEKYINEVIEEQEKASKLDCVFTDDEVKDIVICNFTLFLNKLKQLKEK